MATDIEKVRLLIPDTEQAFDGDTMFEDLDIEGYLEIANGSVLRAASYAVYAVATSEALISKVIRTFDLTTDGAKTAEALHKKAAALAARADKEEELVGAFYSNIVAFQPGYNVPELTEFWNGVDGEISPLIIPGTSFDGGTS